MLVSGGLIKFRKNKKSKRRKLIREKENKIYNKNCFN